MADDWATCKHTPRPSAGSAGVAELQGHWDRAAAREAAAQAFAASDLAGRGSRRAPQLPPTSDPPGASAAR